MGPLFFYWGKTRQNADGSWAWHPLVYHCLDVAAVGAAWLESSASLRLFLGRVTQPSLADHQVRAWLLFFLAAHDLGKWDIRFQWKAPELACRLFPKVDPSGVASKNFDHGQVGYAWGTLELAHWRGLGWDADVWDAWRPWLSAVTGHHGDYQDCAEVDDEYADEYVVDMDRQARDEWIRILEALFLKPAALTVASDIPPPCSDAAKAWIAGFCSVCDWIGSNEAVSPFRAPCEEQALRKYFEQRVEAIIDERWLFRLGLMAEVKPFAGLQVLLEKNESPRGVQVLLDTIPVEPSLVLVEAPTGSGKTEAALAQAWRLLAAGQADSLVFALPTQATANAMFDRVTRFATLAFDRSNAVLAHGRRDQHEGFERLRQIADGSTYESAGVQCAAWLGQSRKRSFLGQASVGTIDQALLSVLPVRHKFVRAFGIGRSVLIVDEVHAYDAYMHGLLAELLRRQKATGGSAVLLSATLPASVRRKLLAAWDADSELSDPPYPAVWVAGDGPVSLRQVPEDQRPVQRSVAVEHLSLAGAFPDTDLLQRIVTAARGGARIAIVMNVVDDVQRLARLLDVQADVPVDVFHARYRFIDRQDREADVLHLYGRHASRDGGRILVASQVVEQSLDLDFDWMLTQLCPVDLLFQRLGRLHRHERARPQGFEVPRCAVMCPDGGDYGLHKLIYGNARVLWRTEQLLRRHDCIDFPEAYREWIEAVYEREEWSDEPEAIYLDYDKFSVIERHRELEAIKRTRMTVKVFRDTEATALSLTRDGEMGLSLLPLLADGKGLDGDSADGLDEGEMAEWFDLRTVPVPASWKNRLRSCDLDIDGRYRLVMVRQEESAWQSAEEDVVFRYSTKYGLEKGGL